MKIQSCDGDISTLLTKAADSISTLTLIHLYDEIIVKEPFKKLRNLVLFGNAVDSILSVLTLSAPFITTLDVRDTNFEIFVEKPFSNLRSLVFRRRSSLFRWLCYEMDIKESPLLSRGGNLCEFGNKFNRAWQENLVLRNND